MSINKCENCGADISEGLSLCSACFANIKNASLSISESLYIGYDQSANDDAACLTVAKRKGNKLIIINQKIGKEATELYNVLSTRNYNSQK